MAQSKRCANVLIGQMAYYNIITTKDLKLKETIILG